MKVSALFLLFTLFFIYGCSRDEDAREDIAEEPLQTIINADHVVDEIEFQLNRSIAATEDLIYWYAENGWNTEELERQLLEKMDELMILYLENGYDMSELEKKLVDLDRQLQSLKY